MRPLFLLCFICLLSAGCSKDGVNQAGYAGSRLVRISTGNKVNSEYSYDNNGRMLRAVSYFAPGILSSESIAQYNTADKLVKLEAAFNVSSSTTATQMDRGYTEFMYGADNRLSESKSYRNAYPIGSSPNYLYVSRSVPSYDAEGRTIAVTIYDPANGQVFSKTTYQYDAQNNVIAEELFQYNAGIQGPSFRTTYEYDNGKNPYKGWWVMPYGANNANITKRVSTNYIATPGNPSTGTMLFVYKSYTRDGYPTLVNENGVDFLYEYK